MQNLMAKQMNDYLVSNNLLSDKQWGFMKARSYTTALVNAVDDLRLKLDDNYHCIFSSFGSQQLLLRKPQTLFHFSNSACGLISSYLINRSQRVYLNGKISNSRNVGRGIPQRSILGSLLFYTYINDLPDVWDNCSLHMYADIV